MTCDTSRERPGPPGRTETEMTEWRNHTERTELPEMTERMMDAEVLRRT